MYQNKTFLAIIPARSGSKGLPNKNIRILCGKPLIAWSIEAGLQSKYIDEVVVSTDSQEYAQIAKSYGAKVPFLRPNELAQDTSTTFESIKHTIDFYKKHLNREFDYVVLLEPTSPLREVCDIDNSIEMLFAHTTAQAIVGVCKTESQNPVFLVKLDSFNFIQSYSNKNFSPIRRQEIEDFFFFEGTIYVGTTQSFLENKGFYHSQTIGYQVPKWKSLEVDDEDDFWMIEMMMKKHIFKCKENL